MREFEIRLRSVQEVQDFVDLATTKPFTVLVCDDYHRVNGKSFMEMFCLNLREPLTVTFQCSDEEYDALCAAADRFMVRP